MKLTAQILTEQANIAERALHLFRNGYRAYEISGYASNPAPIRVVTPKGEEYIVDKLTRRCSCQYFQTRNTHLKDDPFARIIPCKHYVGAAALLLETEADLCEMDVETYRRWKEENEAREF